MKPTPGTTFLDRILTDARADLERARAALPESELLRKLPDAPPVRPFRAALEGTFRVIAEIKRRSPSVGAMRSENVEDAPRVYEESALVGALSILTNSRYFDMDLTDFARIRSQVRKPVLRKEFILDAYQILESRVHGADAVLLMANVLSATEIAQLHRLVLDLGMDALVEVHTVEEIATLPPGLDLCGINSRKFRSASGFVADGSSSSQDFSLEYGAFELVDLLPPGCLRVAESGIHPGNLAAVRGRFDAALIGTSLLRDERGIAACLAEFEQAAALNP